MFVTAGKPIAWTRVRETTEALEISPDLDLLGALAAQAGCDAVEFEPVAGGRDAVVLAVASILKRTHVRDEDLSDVAASMLAHRLAARLLTSYCGLPASTCHSGARSTTAPSIGSRSSSRRTCTRR